jgi:hypothetical protein
VRSHRTTCRSERSPSTRSAAPRAALAVGGPHGERVEPDHHEQTEPVPDEQQREQPDDAEHGDRQPRGADDRTGDEQHAGPDRGAVPGEEVEQSDQPPDDAGDAAELDPGLPGAVRVQVDASDAAAEGDHDDAVSDLVHDRRGQAGDPAEERHEGEHGADEQGGGDGGGGQGGQADIVADRPQRFTGRPGSS